MRNGNILQTIAAKGRNQRSIQSQSEGANPGVWMTTSQSDGAVSSFGWGSLLSAQWKWGVANRAWKETNQIKNPTIEPQDLKSWGAGPVGV